MSKEIFCDIILTGVQDDVYWLILGAGINIHDQPEVFFISEHLFSTSADVLSEVLSELGVCVRNRVCLLQAYREVEGSPSSLGLSLVPHLQV